MLFQSTLPARGATILHEIRGNDRGISIHAPREGSDSGVGAAKQLAKISIHAPREGSDVADSL